jgi:hypothetical protein
MVLVVTVTRSLTSKVVTLHSTCETFTATYRSDVNALACGKCVNSDFLSNGEAIN